MSSEKADPDVRVEDNPDRTRFEAYLDGELAAFVAYTAGSDPVELTHTETLEAYQGMGVASRLVAGALEQLRAAGRQVQPSCPYVASFLRNHPEYADVTQRDAS
jgi:uncharacterized protein